MRIRYRPTLGANSLFTQLFISFLAVILLLLSFNYFSFSFYQKNIRDEIIDYNDVNLDHTTENYESYFALLYRLSLSFYFRDSVQTLAKNHSDYAASNYIVRNEIKSVLSIPNLYLDNFVLYLRDKALVLERNGTVQAQTMFTKFYHNANYPYAFYRSQFDVPFTFLLSPAADYEEIGINKEITASNNLFSFIVKNKLYPDFYLIAFIDTDKLFQAFHQSINESFYIADSTGRPIYASQLGAASGRLPAFTGEQGAVRQGSYYYFYKKGAETGLTYVNMVPLENITSQVKRLRLTLWSVLLAALGIGLITSMLFTLRFHGPVKQIIRSIHNFGGHAEQPSRIKEFALIGENIRHMLETNRSIHQSMNDSKALLQYYAFTNRIKKIAMDLPDLQELIVNPHPYQLVLYELKFKSRYKDEIGIELEQAVLFIKEAIDLHIAERHQGALTFPIEFDQMLSIVFLPPDDPPIMETLQQIVSLMEVDRDYYFAAIALSGVCKQPAEFIDAYEQALALLNDRVIRDNTEIWSASERRTPPDVAFTIEQEYEFSLQLYAGNYDNTMLLIRRTLSAMQRKEATAIRCAQFANDLLARMLNALRKLNLESAFLQRLPSPQQRLQECYTVLDYDRFFDAAVTEATQLIRIHKEAADPIVDFVVQYLDRYYAQDITLDIIADKLGISSGYLSTYFKEKTQKNFIDYVNEVRIANAKTQLKQSNARIQQIAAAVGYQNMNSFNRMFKKFTGLTPSEYRMKHKQ